MTERELSIKLREDARRLNLCDEWYSQWKDDTTQQQLIDKFKRGLDFCISRRWPSTDFIKGNFQQDLLIANGILVDAKHSYPIRDKETRRHIHIRDYVLIGKSACNIRFSFKRYVSNVWAMDDSNVRAYVKYGAFILIHAFDKATVYAETDLVSRITVVRHSPDTVVKTTGNVTVKNEFHYLE